MALTIEQIQTNIDNKMDARAIINQMADYIQANPSAGGSSYLVYTALISQSGTAAPEVVSNGSGANTPLQNTLGGTVVWSYVETGYYRATLNGAFPEGKVIIFVQIGRDDSLSFFEGDRETDDRCGFVTKYDGDEADDVLFESAVEIRVYP